MNEKNDVVINTDGTVSESVQTPDGNVQTTSGDGIIQVVQGSSNPKLDPDLEALRKIRQVDKCFPLFIRHQLGQPLTKII